VLAPLHRIATVYCGDDNCASGGAKDTNTMVLARLGPMLTADAKRPASA
jgi:hypothetical protein